MSAQRNIFVFGSNLAGRHGAGSAYHAMKAHRAMYGVGVGLTGDAYAIPTKDAQIQTMSLDEIRPYVRDFIQFAASHPDWSFQLVAIGCGLAGYTPEEIAPMFDGVGENVALPTEFLGLVDA